MVITPGRRWLIISQYYPPEIGAPQIRLRSVARELRRHGIDVEVLTALPNYPAGKIFPNYRGRWTVRETIEDVPVTRTWVYAGTGKSKVVRLANYFSFTMSALIALLIRPQPDLIFVESQPLSLGLVAVMIKWLKGVPFIYNVPDLQVDVAREMGFMSNRRLLQLAFRLENFFLSRAWKISTVTDQFIEHFHDRGFSRKKISFLPNGADTEFLRPKKPSKELLDRWSVHDKKVFLYVGTHAYYHGLETLIDAADLLRERRDIVFIMVGDGPERSRLKEICIAKQLQNVIFATSPYEEMDQLYSIGYASVATLRNIEVAKGMRLSKVFPSLSCGVPVVYAGFGEAAELIVRNNCGIVTTPEKPALLANAISDLASQPALRSELGRNGRTLVEKEYSWSAIVKNWLFEIGVADNREKAGYSLPLTEPLDKQSALP
jgi:glycosyltransferase involved in cell wall biosynthesis